MTPHNEAKLDEIAKVVLMPGDPLRAKYIANNVIIWDLLQKINEEKFDEY